MPRYYSNALLDSIHRSIAIEEWHRLRLDRDSLDAQIAGVRLERALGAFDMFVLHDQFGDLDDVSLPFPHWWYRLGGGADSFCLDLADARQ